MISPARLLAPLSTCVKYVKVAFYVLDFIILAVTTDWAAKIHNFLSNSGMNVILNHAGKKHLPSSHSGPVNPARQLHLPVTLSHDKLFLHVQAFAQLGPYFPSSHSVKCL